MFCLTLRNTDLTFIEKMNYLPVGLGDNITSKVFFSDKLNDSIAFKNKFYGEYTFHYWIWKNYYQNIKTDWVGFCQYRKFFLKEKIKEEKISFQTLKKYSINDIDDSFKEYDCILGEQFSVTNFKLMKIIKNYPKEFLLNPKKIFYKNTRTIKFHFDLYHGKGNLDKAIDLLDADNRDDFRKFVNTRTSFNPHNMFICKKNFLINYYNSIFSWLEKCESIFGFKDLHGYGMQRIYGFLAERYLSYWFQKNCRVKELPIVVKDFSDYKNL